MNSSPRESSTITPPFPIGDPATSTRSKKRQPRRASSPKKNRLNDLSGKDWLVHTKTVMMDITDRTEIAQVETALENGVMLSQAPPRDALKKAHPATFSEKDVGKLVRFFTCKDNLVLDPFMGSGSTAIACMEETTKLYRV